MSDQVNVPPEVRPTYRADRLRVEWPQVHVDFAEAAPCAGGCRVRAVVQLHGLAPADVVVTLAPAAEFSATARSAGRGADARRMWSCESYDNGRFLFERMILAGDDRDVRDWVVAVRPTDALVGRPVVYPLRVEVAAGSAGR